MKITYNETEKTIEINDGIKNQYFVLKLIMSLNLINTVLNLYDINKSGIGIIEIAWLIIGIISIIILFIFIYQKSTSEKIAIEKIEGIKEKSVFGRTKYSFKLRNGKYRDLGIKTQHELSELNRMFTEIGITT